jgi:hypothetical protein
MRSTARSSSPTPDDSVVRPIYNEANLLERLDANLRGAATATPFVADIDYDAKGQRTEIAYGNGVRTTYAYDPETFRLVRLKTMRGADALQDLSYTYDPVGNITQLQHDAQQTLYFRNRRVDPGAKYTYDAIYRLIAATGREHLGQTGDLPDPPTPPDPFDAVHTRLAHPGDDGIGRRRPGLGADHRSVLYFRSDPGPGEVAADYRDARRPGRNPGFGHSADPDLLARVMHHWFGV